MKWVNKECHKNRPALYRAGLSFFWWRWAKLKSVLDSKRLSFCQSVIPTTAVTKNGYLPNMTHDPHGIRRDYYGFRDRIRRF
jgi:hypothetical protein